MGLADRMAGEQVACPRCAQRLLVPAALRPIERPLTASGPPPVPRRSIFPDFPVVLDPPDAGLRVGVAVEEPKVVLPRPFQARLVGVFLFLGGLVAIANPIAMSAFSGGLCCVCLPMFLEMIWGVVAVIRGLQILFVYRPRSPVILVIIQIHLCGAFDLVNTLLGIFNLLMLCAPRARAYFRNEWGE
jgi:hypothetical protein